MIYMSHTLKCPICHGNLIHVTPITLESPLDVIGYTAYCPSLRCRVYKVILDSNYNVLHIKKFSNIMVKRRIIAKALSQNWNKYSKRTKSKLMQKYKRAKKYL